MEDFKYGRDPVITSVKGGYAFKHYGFRSWDCNSLQIVGKIPTSYVVKPLRVFNETYYYPVDDFIYKQKHKPPIMFTSDHSRLLFELLQAGELPQKLYVVNDDYHDDIFMGDKGMGDEEDGYNRRAIECGRWVSSGLIERLFSNYIHVKKGITLNDEGINRQKMIRGVTVPIRYSQYDLQNGDVTASDVLQQINGSPFIFTVDADSHVGETDIVFTTDDRDTMERFTIPILQAPNLWLVHFTPSPEYTNPDAVADVWSFFSRLYCLYVLGNDINYSKIMGDDIERCNFVSNSYYFGR